MLGTTGPPTMNNPSLCTIPHYGQPLTMDNPSPTVYLDFSPIISDTIDSPIWTKYSCVQVESLFFLDPPMTHFMRGDRSGSIVLVPGFVQMILDCMRACMRVCLYACMPVCLYACMYICVYACMRVCVYASMCVRLDTHLCIIRTVLWLVYNISRLSNIEVEQY